MRAPILFLLCVSLKKPIQEYDDLIKTIKDTYPNHCKLLLSQWLVETDETPAEIYKNLKEFLDDNDEMIINKLVKPYYRKLIKSKKDWIDEHI